ncbi:MAG TPA: hypothetical protein VHM90_08610, partial [Phycisphaerae bacterium]|nr:hypothetical protein [Phycisphaerae bacterium]
PIPKPVSITLPLCPAILRVSKKHSSLRAPISRFSAPRGAQEMRVSLADKGDNAPESTTRLQTIHERAHGPQLPTGVEKI